LRLRGDVTGLHGDGAVQYGIAAQVRDARLKLGRGQQDDQL